MIDKMALTSRGIVVGERNLCKMFDGPRRVYKRMLKRRSRRVVDRVVAEVAVALAEDRARVEKERAEAYWAAVQEEAYRDYIAHTKIERRLDMMAAEARREHIRQAYSII